MILKNHWMKIRCQFLRARLNKKDRVGRVVDKTASLTQITPLSLGLSNPKSPSIRKKSPSKSANNSPVAKSKPKTSQKPPKPTTCPVDHEDWINPALLIQVTKSTHPQRSKIGLITEVNHLSKNLTILSTSLLEHEQVPGENGKAGFKRPIDPKVCQTFLFKAKFSDVKPIRPSVEEINDHSRVTLVRIIKSADSEVVNKLATVRSVQSGGERCVVKMVEKESIKVCELDHLAKAVNLTEALL
jgi:hypothetical protein